MMPIVVAQPNGVKALGRGLQFISIMGQEYPTMGFKSRTQKDPKHEKRTIKKEILQEIFLFFYFPQDKNI